MTPERAVQLASDAIDHDDRRHPYGHHQWGRRSTQTMLNLMLAVVEAAIARQASTARHPDPNSPYADEIGHWPEDAAFAEAVSALQKERLP